MGEGLYNLACRGEAFPLNVTGDVYFSWSLSGCREQKGFRIRVCKDGECVYSAERQGGEQTFYAQPFPLEALALYRYTVEVETDTFRESADGYFRAGLTEGFDKRAKWISDGSRFVAESREAGSPALYLKKTFDAPKKPESAVVSICGLGLYELRINGAKVGDRVLDPAFTEYDKRVLYATYEAADYLRQGENRIEVILGDGWYNQTTRDTWGFYRAAWRDCPKLLFQMNWEESTLVSDESWLISAGEIVSNALRAGEYWDFTAKREYRPARVTAPPGGEFVPSCLPPLRECEILAPVEVFAGDGCVIYDFGKNISGYVGATLRGARGERALIEYSDRLKDGRCDNVGYAVYLFNEGLRYQTDGCTLSGGEDAFKPKFVYHGFRYAAVSGKVTVKDIRAYFVHTDLQRFGEFDCSDERLNRLYRMSVNAVLSNYVGFPTDCPHREKNGWTGDAQLSLETCLFHFDMREAYRKWLEDFAVNQRPSGQISGIVPSGGWGYNWGSGPAWDAALFRITDALYTYYGDVQIAGKMYPHLKRYHDYVSSFVKDGLVCLGLGDWNYPKRVRFAVCPTELTDSGYYKLMSEILAKLAARFEPEKASGYLAAAEAAAQALREKYGKERSLTGLAALTYFGIADKTLETAEYLEENDCQPHAGILGVKFLLDTLGRGGKGDLAADFLRRTDYPSFGYWAERGQTALCEDFELENSLNHHMFSPIAEYLCARLCGLRLKNPREAELKPRFPSDLARAFARSGGFSVSIERRGSGAKLRFTVPANARLSYRGKEYGRGEYEAEYEQS